MSGEAKDVGEAKGGRAAQLKHTGLRHGHSFNLVLMEVFLAVLLTGALLGALAWRAPRNAIWNRLVTATHLFLVWILPAFVAIHVLKVYYF